MRLLEGEQILMELKPHPLAFMRYISICIYYLAVGASFRYIYTTIMSLMPPYQALSTYIPLVAWSVLVLVAPLLVGLLHVTFWPLLASSLLCATGALLVLVAHFPVDRLTYLTILAGLLGFVIVELYRRGHRYYITNQRLIATRSFLFRDERFVDYEDITDLVIHQGLIGRIFGFGDVIPITSSGLATGTDVSMAVAGGQVRRLGLGVAVGGGRMVRVPRMRTFMGFFGVSDPDAVRDRIEAVKASWREVPYLKRIARATEELLRHELKEDR